MATLPFTEVGAFRAVCPWCGDAWARLDGAGQYSAFVFACPSCPTPEWINLPGSLITPFVWWDPEVNYKGGLSAFLLRHPAWIKHEFEMHLAWSERNA